MTATARRMYLTVSRAFVALRTTASVRAKVNREVRRRDEAKCQRPLASGGICGAAARLEIDHLKPRGYGDPSTVENCRILRQAHDLEAARQAYGDAHPSGSIASYAGFGGSRAS